MVQLQKAKDDAFPLLSREWLGSHRLSWRENARWYRRYPVFLRTCSVKIYLGNLRIHGFFLLSARLGALDGVHRLG